jgi:phospholipid transport system substrate-binding protein
MYRKLIAFLAALVPVLALAQEGPDALVKRTTDEVLAIIKSDKDLQSGNSRKVVELAEAKVLPHFDFMRMTRLAVGRNWAQATDAQKEALTKEFRTLLVRTYSTSLSQYRNQAIEPRTRRPPCAPRSSSRAARRSRSTTRWRRPIRDGRSTT